MRKKRAPKNGWFSRRGGFSERSPAASKRRLCVEPLENRQLLSATPFENHFDFGTRSSPVEPGFTRVTESTTYASEVGFGWLSGDRRSADRRSGSALVRDFVFAHDATFAVDVPNGRYQVDMVLGDLGMYGHDLVGVSIEGTRVDTVSTSARQVVGRTHEVEVTDGQLTFRLHDLGGRDYYGVIESLEISTLEPPQPILSIGDVRIDEGDAGQSVLAFPLTLFPPSSQDVSVRYTTQDSSAKAGDDYVAAKGTLRIPAGQTSEVIYVTATGDTVVEPDETFRVTLSNMAGGVLGRSRATGTIVSDDSPPFQAHFDFGANSSPVQTGFERVSHTTSYSTTRGYGWIAGSLGSADRRTGSALARDFVYGRGATFITDVPNGRYQVDLLLGDLGRYAHDQVGLYLEGDHVGTVSTAAGQVVSRSYEVEVTDGQLTFRMADLGGQDYNGVIEALEVTSLGPGMPELSIGDVRLEEGDAGTRDFVFPVSLSSPAPEDVVVTYATSNGSAAAGRDYTATSGSVRIRAGDKEALIAVPVRGDQTVESVETFYVNLGGADGVVLARSRGTGSIINDDVSRTLYVSVSPDVISEAGGAGAATGVVRRTGAIGSALTVKVASSDTGEASVPATVQIPAGDSSATFSISAHDDQASDGSQQVTITASAAGYVSGQADLEVTDDDLPPFEAHFDFGSAVSPVQAGFTRVTDGTRYSAALGHGWTGGNRRSADRGAGPALTRDFVYSGDTTFATDVPNGRYQVDLMLGDVGRYAHDQVGLYLEGSHVGTVSTAAGQVVTRSYVVEVVDEQLTLRMVDLGGRDYYGVIESLEITASGPLVPELSIGDAKIEEGDTGTRSIAFPVSLNATTTQDVTVRYVTTAGSATEGDDYRSASGTLRIPAGKDRGTIRVYARGDTTIEPDETFFVRLSDASGATLDNNRGRGTIVNDDIPATLIVSVTPGEILENAGSNAAVGTVRRTGPNTTAMSVRLSSSDGSEASIPTSVQIAAGRNSATFPVAARDDTDHDGTQHVTIVASASGLVSGSTVLDVLDDDMPPFTAYFDFGTNNSPTQSGFARVSESTRYSATRGYGWSAGTINSRDRGGAGALERDINYTTDGTFLVDLPNGQYWVDIILGDRGAYSHDYMGVYLEGARVDAVSTAARQLAHRSYDVQVNDGQLQLQLRDLGGSDGNTVIEGLRIVPQGANLGELGVWWPASREIPGAVFSQPYSSGGFVTYAVNSQYQRSENTVRVLLPQGYDASKLYSVVYVLPVEAGNGRQFGDGLTTVKNAGLHRRYPEAIFVAPTFTDVPWFADHVSNSSIWQETYFRTVVVPFVESQYPVIDGPDGRLLLGFSKSGYGAVSMLLRHPDYFGRAVTWDSPLAMSNPADGWGFLDVLGSRANFYNNFQITTLLRTQGPLLKDQPTRLFLQGYSYDFTLQDHRTIDALMTSLGIPHDYDPGVYRKHVWSSGWISAAVDALLSD